MSSLETLAHIEKRYRLSDTEFPDGKAISVRAELPLLYRWKMTSSKFRAEVKERNPGEPCFVIINTDQSIGLDRKQIVFDLPAGTGIADARKVADALNGLSVSVR